MERKLHLPHRLIVCNLRHRHCFPMTSTITHHLIDISNFTAFQRYMYECERVSALIPPRLRQTQCVSAVAVFVHLSRWRSARGRVLGRLPGPSTVAPPAAVVVTTGRSDVAAFTQMGYRRQCRLPPLLSKVQVQAQRMAHFVLS